MKKIILLPLVLITGCTTIGQQITNRDGIVQVHQQQSPITVTANTNAVTKPVVKSKTTNNVVRPVAKPNEDTLVEVSSTLISRQYILN
jgi:hypothetical protein